ncbi:YDG domain-containing protein [Tropicimonas sp.]|uniref:YDG domain-containing protein n=1 Tax=Tropicimonas sp. TaxID=2067044 RepID=UPI003A895378
MNRFFRVIWSRTQQRMIVVPEVGGTCPGKASARRRRRQGEPQSGLPRAILLAVLLTGTAAGLAQAQTAQLALPQNGQVAAGKARIGTTGPGAMVIDQRSQRAAINWGSFDIGSRASVEFRQPSAGSVALNRVTGDSPSRILGRMSANGQVFLTNKRGVYFGPGARVDVGGLVATTHSISDGDFMSGKTDFTRDGATGKVVNAGRLEAAAGGYIALLAPEVRNNGVIVARKGTVALAAGEAFNLEFDEGGGLASLRVTPGQMDELVENGHLIEAPGGQVIMSAGAANAVRSSVVRNSGKINARGIQRSGGRVFLGGARVETTTKSRIVASAALQSSPRPALRPERAEVHVDAARVALAGAIDVSGPTGGTVAVEGDHIALAGTATIDATGLNGGGDVLIGGDWQGGADPERLVFAASDAMRQARTVSMADGARIDASAIRRGDGGRVVLWSDVSDDASVTRVQGEIFARGGAGGGDGGAIETSGHRLFTAGATGSAAAPKGKAGEWLFDPTDITVSNDTTTGGGVTGSTVTSGEIAGLLNGGTSVTLTADRNLTWNANAQVVVAPPSEVTLALNSKGTAASTLSFGAGSRIETTGSPLNVDIRMRTENAFAYGIVNLSGLTAITNGGDFSVANAVHYDPGAAIHLGAGTLIDTGSGNISLSGYTNNTGGADGRNFPILIEGATLAATDGDITLGGNLSGTASVVWTGSQAVRIVDGADISTTGSGDISISAVTGGGNAESLYLMIIDGNTRISSGGALDISAVRTVGAGRALQTGSAELSAVGDVTISASENTAYNWTYSIGNTDISSSSGNVLISTEGSQFNIEGNGSITTGADGDLTLRADQLYRSASQTLTTNVGGNLVIEPFSASFPSSFIFRGNMSGTNFTATDDLSGLIVNDIASMEGLTLGKENNQAQISLLGPLSLPGAVTVYAGPILVSGNVTSFGDGDILLRATAGGNNQFLNNGTITKSGGAGTLTMKGNARVINNTTGVINTADGGVLNVVLWSDFDNDNDDGGVSQLGTISTGGGHVWMGGSNSVGGTSTWNGLTVGDGPSVGHSGFNNNALDLFGNVTTDGGDLLVWAGNGTVAAAHGIVTDSDGARMTLGGGDAILIADQVNGGGLVSVILDGAGAVTLAPDGGSYASTLTWTHNDVPANLNIGGLYNYLQIDGFNNLTGLTFGEYAGMSGVTIGNTSDIAFSSGAAINGPISVRGGAVAINSGLTATGDRISLNASGAVTQTAALTADALLLKGTGTFTLTGSANSVGTIAGGSAATWLGGLSYTNAGALSIGTVSGTDGITATGNVLVETLSGDLTLAQGVATTGTGANAVLLNAGRSEAAGTASGGNIIVSGVPAVTAGAGGTIRLMSGSIVGSTGLTALVGAGSGNFRYNSDETNTNYTTALATNAINAIYREAPVLSGTIANANKTYGDADPTFSISGGTGPLNGDDMFTVLSPQSSGAGILRAGSYGLSAADFAALGYTLGSITDGTLTVAKKALTVSGLSGQDKAYDGTTAAAVNGTAALQTAVAPGAGTGSDGKAYTGDAVDLTGTATGAFNDKDVADATGVSFGGLSLTGADAANYTLTPHADDTAARIAPQVLTLSAAKTYDGKATLAGAVTLGGLVGSETLSYTASANDAHVATTGKYIKTITLADGSGGGRASNYRLPALNAANAPVTISARVLTPALTNSGVTKVYDGTAAAPAGFVPTYSFAGLIAGDTGASLSAAGIVYNDANVALANTLTVSGLALTAVVGSNGSRASDYTLGTTSRSVAATITPAVLTVTANNDARFLTQSDSAGYAGVSYASFVNGENESTAAGFIAPTVSRTARGPDGNVTAANSIAGTYSGQLRASGGAADNYSFSYKAGDYTIVPSGQLLVRVDDVNDTYGNAATYQIASVEYFDGAQIVRLDNGSVPGSGVSVGAGNRVTVNDGAAGSASFRLAPQDGVYSTAQLLARGSYQLGTSGRVTENSVNFSDVVTVVGAHEVTAKAVSASASSGISKVYDGTTDMSGVTLALAGTETGDLVSVGGTGAYADRNAGTNKSYAISDILLGGVDAANYYLTGASSFSGTNGTITPRELTALFSADDKVYDGNRDASVSGQSADIVSGDQVGFAQGSALFSDKNVGSGKSVAITGISLTGSDAGNYLLASATASTTASISRLNEVVWVGGETGDWFDPANWAGGAVPDLSNVANVVIPEGVEVTFGDSVVPPAESGPVEVDSIREGGSLTQSGGELNVGDGGMTLDGYSQSGGTFGSAGDVVLGEFEQTGGSFATTDGSDLTVTDNFSQSGDGSVSVAGDADITDSSGGAVLGNLSVDGTLDVNSTDGAIEQAGGTTISVDGETTLTAEKDGAPADITLDGKGNDFGGRVNADGNDITLNDVNGLTLGDVMAKGALDATAGGTLDLAGVISADRVDLTSTGGDVVQSGGSLTVRTGPSRITAKGKVDISQPGNSIAGGVTVESGDLRMREEAIIAARIEREMAAWFDSVARFSAFLTDQTLPPPIEDLR